VLLYYLDTSSLAKGYLTEIGSGWVDATCSRESIATSSLSEVEIASTLAQRVREGSLGATEADDVFRQFLTDLGGYAVVGLSPSILKHATELLLVRLSATYLRTLDSLHLACAKAAFTEARQSGLEVASFVTSDRQLDQAARLLGLAVLNPEDYP
jgi:predicted nucleic acid-binding protein